MVMNEEQIQDAPQEEQNVDISEEPVEDSTVESGGFTDTDTVQQAPPPAPEPAPEPQQDTQAQQAMYQQQQQELQARRVAEQEAVWREDVGRRARTYQQQLENSGYLPDHAREQAKNMIQQEYNQVQSQQRVQQVAGEMEGRSLATLHFMERYGLADKSVIETMKALQNARTPSEMEREAARMQKDRKTEAELTKLRQGQVQPQTFDSSQGSAEASTSNDRLLKAYENGDRSEAAVRAARNLTLGG